MSDSFIQRTQHSDDPPRPANDAVCFDFDPAQTYPQPHTRSRCLCLATSSRRAYKMGSQQRIPPQFSTSIISHLPPTIFEKLPSISDFFVLFHTCLTLRTACRPRYATGAWQPPSARPGELSTSLFAIRAIANLLPQS